MLKQFKNADGVCKFQQLNEYESLTSCFFEALSGGFD